MGWRVFRVSIVLLVIALLAVVVFAVVVLWLMGTNHIDDGRAASLNARMAGVAEQIAIFVTEDIRDGERIGPIDCLTPNSRSSTGTEWLTETEARKLARERRWQFRVD